MSTDARLRTTLIAPIAAFAAVGAMTIVSPVSATPSASSASVTSTASAASAASARTRIAHKDNLRDVRRGPADRTVDLKRVRTNKTADITRLTATYGRKLVLTSTTRKTMPKTMMGVVARVATGTDGYDYQVDFIRGFLGQGNYLSLSTNQFEPVTCAGLKVKRANAKHRIKVIVPARCIGRPTRVRVGLATVLQKRDTVFIDDAFSKTSDGIAIAMSRWLKRR